MAGPWSEGTGSTRRANVMAPVGGLGLIDLAQRTGPALFGRACLVAAGAGLLGGGSLGFGGRVGWRFSRQRADFGPSLGDPELLHHAEGHMRRVRLE
jgi:hypothetical protein